MPQPHRGDMRETGHSVPTEGPSRDRSALARRGTEPCTQRPLARPLRLLPLCARPHPPLQTHSCRQACTGKRTRSPPAGQQPQKTPIARRALQRSMRQKTEGGPDRVAVLQVLAVEQRLLAVRGLPDAVDEQRGLFTISAQPLVTWGGPSDADALQGHLEVFVAQKPQGVDVLLVAGTSLECRAGMLKWRAVFASKDHPARVARLCTFVSPPVHAPASSHLCGLAPLLHRRVERSLSRRGRRVACACAGAGCAWAGAARGGLRVEARAFGTAWPWRLCGSTRQSPLFARGGRRVFRGFGMSGHVCGPRDAFSRRSPP